MEKALKYIAPVLLYMAAVAFLSLGRDPVPDIGVDNIDKLYHFSAYVVLGALMQRMFAAVWPGSVKRAVFAAVFLGAFFGGAMEVLQGLTSYRTMDLSDALANGLGSYAGAALYSMVKRFIPAGLA